MPDLAYQSLAVLTGLAGLALLYWSMFRDRSRGRRRCPKCWYDLRGGDSLTCPECGYTAKRARQFFKTRRKWRWAALALVSVFAAVPLWLTPKARRDGWLSVTPATVIIASLPWTRTSGAVVLIKRWRDPKQSTFPKAGVWSWQAHFAMWEAKRMLDARYDTDTRTSMLVLLRWLDPHEPRGPILLRWLHDNDPQIRIVASLRAGTAELDDATRDPIVSQLCELVKDPDPKVQLCAISSLSKFINTNQNAREVLIDGLSNPSGALREKCATAMGRLESPEQSVLDRLCNLINSRDDAAYEAAMALRSIGNASVAPILIACIRKGPIGPDLGPPRACALALLGIGEPVRSAENAAALGALLDSPDRHVCTAAILALMGQGQDAEALLDRIEELLTRDMAENIGTLLHYCPSDNGLTSEMGAPILLMVVARMQEFEDWQTTDYYALETAVRLLGLFPDHVKDSLPLLIRLLTAPRNRLRDQAIGALQNLGSAATPALPALRALMDETTDPKEDKLLKQAIWVIEDSPPKR